MAKSNGRLLLLLLLLLLAALVVLPVRAAELEGVAFPDQVTVGGTTLVLNGLGLREATVLMVNVYVAGLYVEAKTSEANAILDPARAKQLVLRFVRSVGKEKLVEAWNDGFEKNAGNRRAALADGISKLNAAMTDVKKEDIVTLTYLPGSGVTVTVKGEDAAIVTGDEFQRALFSIWLGAHPPNVGLREGLLGRLNDH